MNKKILVTGANGYIGSHLVKTLLDNGNEVIALDFKSNNIDDRATVHSYDIFNDNENLLKDLAIVDTVVHLAWKDGFIHNSQNHIKFLPLHFDFINKCIENNVKHITVMGTMHEVGYHVGKIDEYTPTNPLSLYAIAKNALRQGCNILFSNNKEVCFQWIRAFYIYGDDEKNNSIFAKLLKANKSGQKTFHFSTGKNEYDFLNIDDLANQIASTVMQTKVQGIINCCSGKPIALKDMIEKFIKENNLDIQLAYGEYPDRAYDSPVIYGDNTKILEILKENK